MEQDLVIIGAKENNLKDINLTLPRNKCRIPCRI